MSLINQLSKKLVVNNEVENIKEYERIRQSFLQSSPFISEILEIFTNYYKTIIKPPTSFNIVLQHSSTQIEDLKKMSMGSAVYTYLVSFVPLKKEWPIRIKDSESEEFSRSGVLAILSWHPNVAAHFTIDLIDQYNSKTHKYLNILRPEIKLRVWGNIAYNTSFTLIGHSQIGTFYKVHNHISILTHLDGGWDKPASELTLTINDTNISMIKMLLEEALIIITPNILNYLPKY